MIAFLKRLLKPKRRADSPPVEPLPKVYGAEPGPDGFVPLQQHIQDQISRHSRRPVEPSGA